jgi:hypothetical protein
MGIVFGQLILLSAVALAAKNHFLRQKRAPLSLFSPKKISFFSLPKAAAPIKAGAPANKNANSPAFAFNPD